MLKTTVLMMTLLSFSNVDKNYEDCVKASKCPHDGKNFSDLTDSEKHEAYHCRVRRHLECSIPERDE